MKLKPNFYLSLSIKKDPKLRYLKLLGKNTSHSRSTVKIRELKNKVIIEVESKDITAMRASANSILRDLQVIEATNTTGKLT